MQYYTVVVQLFLPLLHGDFFQGDYKAELRRIVVHHARCGIEPLEHVKRIYGTRFLSPTMMFCLIHLGDTLFRFSSDASSAASIIDFCLEALQQARPGFPMCGPLQALFCREFERTDIRIPNHIREISDSLKSYTFDDFLDVCLRLEYTQPIDPILRYFDRQVAETWPNEWEAQVVRRKRQKKAESSGEYLRINSLLNT